jgi:mono/diheme cytochrome c family protein
MKTGVVLLAGAAFFVAPLLSAQEAGERFALGQGRALYLTHCAGCHGALGFDTKGQRVHLPGGATNGGGAPDLARIQLRDGSFTSVHVARHVSGRECGLGSGPTMPCWKRHFENEWPTGEAMAAVKVYWLTKYLASNQETERTARR